MASCDMECSSVSKDINYEWSSPPTEYSINEWAGSKDEAYFCEDVTSADDYESDMELCKRLGLSNKSEFSAILMNLLSQYGLTPETVYDDSVNDGNSEFRAEHTEHWTDTNLTCNDADMSYNNNSLAASYTEHFSSEMQTMCSNLDQQSSFSDYTALTGIEPNWALSL